MNSTFVTQPPALTSGGARRAGRDLTDQEEEAVAAFMRTLSDGYVMEK